MGIWRRIQAQRPFHCSSIYLPAVSSQQHLNRLPQPLSTKRKKESCRLSHQRDNELLTRTVTSFCNIHIYYVSKACQQSQSYDNAPSSCLTCLIVIHNMGRPRVSMQSKRMCKVCLPPVIKQIKVCYGKHCHLEYLLYTLYETRRFCVYEL